jgi:hypothetical protein
LVESARIARLKASSASASRPRWSAAWPAAANLCETAESRGAESASAFSRFLA